MKRFTFAGACTIALLASGYAFARDDATLTIAPEHEKIIRDYVIQEHMKPVDAGDNFAVGAMVPNTVELAPVPEQIYTTAPEVKRYQYFYWNNHVVFVDPDSRRIVDVID